MHNIGNCDEQHILNLELVSFFLKHMVSTKQLSITDLSGRKESDLHKGIKETLYLFILGRSKWKMYNFHFALFCF